MTFVIDSLKKSAKTKRALFIKFDPSLILKSYLIGENVEENINTLKTIEILQKCGANGQVGPKTFPRVFNHAIRLMFIQGEYY